MKAAVLYAPAPIAQRPLVIKEVPKPSPGPGEVLLRVLACGVCRTDLHILEGELPPLRTNGLVRWNSTISWSVTLTSPPTITQPAEPTHACGKETCWCECLRRSWVFPWSRYLDDAGPRSVDKLRLSHAALESWISSRVTARLAGVSHLRQWQIRTYRSCR